MTVTKKKKGINIYKKIFRWGCWDCYNFPCFRKKSHYRKALRQKDIVDDYKKDYKIKSISSNYVCELDPYQDDKAMAWNERRSWKRNSKKKKQWEK